MIGDETSLNKFSMFEITEIMFLAQNRMKLEINSRREVEKFTNMWKFCNTPWNNQWFKEETTMEIIKYFEGNITKMVG